MRKSRECVRNCRRAVAKDSDFHPCRIRPPPSLALVPPVSNRHNHHLVDREAQETTKTKPGSRRRHTERTKRQQTNPTQSLGATPHHTHAVTRCNATTHATQSLGASKTTIFRSGRPQLVENSARTHKKMKKPGKFVEFAGFALILEIRTFFGVCFSFL